MSTKGQCIEWAGFVSRPSPDMSPLTLAAIVPAAEGFSDFQRERQGEGREGRFEPVQAGLGQADRPWLPGRFQPGEMARHAAGKRGRVAEQGTQGGVTVHQRCSVGRLWRSAHQAGEPVGRVEVKGQDRQQHETVAAWAAVLPWVCRQAGLARAGRVLMGCLVAGGAGFRREARGVGRAHLELRRHQDEEAAQQGLKLTHPGAEGAGSGARKLIALQDEPRSLGGDLQRIAHGGKARLYETRSAHGREV